MRHAWDSVARTRAASARGQATPTQEIPVPGPVCGADGSRPALTVGGMAVASVAGMRSFYPPQSRSASGVSILMTIFAASLPLLLDACDAIEEPPGLQTVDNVEKHPSEFIGKRVTLTGEVDSVFNDRAFELGGLQWMFGGDVLVVTRTPVTLGKEKLAEGREIALSGVVREFVVTDIERELQWDLERKLEIEWQDKPVVIADSISAVESYATWTGAPTPKSRIVSMWALYSTAQAGDLDGAEMALTNAELTERREGPGFWIGLHGHPRLFAVAAPGEQLTKLPAGSRIDVEGTLHAMPPMAEATKRWSLTDAERQQLSGEAVFLEVDSLTSDERSAGKPGATTDTTEG